MEFGEGSRGDLGKFLVFLDILRRVSCGIRNVQTRTVDRLRRNGQDYSPAVALISYSVVNQQSSRVPRLVQVPSYRAHYFWVPTDPSSESSHGPKVSPTGSRLPEYCSIQEFAIFGLAQNLIQNQAEGTARLAEKEQSSQLFGPAQRPQTLYYLGPVPPPGVRDRHSTYTGTKTFE
jgi:hypothetical protein